MNTIKESEIVFGEPVKGDISNIYQDILYNNNVIGAIRHYHSGLLQPVKLSYQRLVHESEINDINYDHVTQSEDDGYKFVIWDNLSDFLKNLK